MSASSSARALPPELEAALAAGVTVVTPNKRLARRIVSAFDDAQHAAGHAAWPAARVQPWTAWLQTLWLDVVAAAALPDLPRLLTSGQSGYLWDRIIDADTEHSTPFVDRRGASKLAANAWQLVNAWGAGGASWRGWSTPSVDDDTAAFVRWAERYTAALSRRSAIDVPQLADLLSQCAPLVPVWRQLAIALAGFIEISPQQERLLAALATCGATISRCDTLRDQPANAVRASAATPHDELALALRWARARVVADPDSIVAIAVDDLTRRRAEVIALAEEVLCPRLQWPGHEDAPRPYNISLGERLDELPIVATAIGLIALAHGPLPAERAATLLRSPYIAGASAQWMARAAGEQLWIERGQREVGLGDFIGTLVDFDPVLGQRWRVAAESSRLPATASPREWIEAWQAWLIAVGWPGERTLGSAEYQARGALDEALAHLAALHVVEPRMTRSDALQALRSLAADTLFAPEVPHAPVQILGFLEAAGQPFDALWVTGLAAERWPAAPQPNPLLPVNWQRERNVPHSSAARELAYARAFTAQLLRAAETVVVSHAHSGDGHPRAASSLIEAWPLLDGGIAVAKERPLIEPLPALDDTGLAIHRNEMQDRIAAGFTQSPYVSTAQAMSAAAPSRERVADELAPPLEPGSRAPGGAGLIEKQSDCPFRAVACHRLRVQTWPEMSEGLTPMERGILVHRALAAFWRDLLDQAALLVLAPDALLRRIESAVGAAMSSNAIPAARWRQLPAVVVEGEARRIVELIGSSIDRFDRARPPFVVQDVEREMTVTLSGLTFRLRLDRVDTLAAGGMAVIDYKTGRATPARTWFDDRPQAPQLALYTLAMATAAPSSAVRAAAYVQMKPGELRLHGLAADDEAWPGLTLPSALRGAGLDDWPAVESRWRVALGALADEIAAGHAAVAPRDATMTCRTCGMQPLCRIGAWLAGEVRDEADV